MNETRNELDQLEHASGETVQDHKKAGCLECGKPVADSLFCDSDCRTDHAQRIRLNGGW